MSSFFEKLKGISENLEEREKELAAPVETQEIPATETVTEETSIKPKKTRKIKWINLLKGL